jgi:transketolase
MRSTAWDGLQDRATRLRIHAVRATTAAGSGHPTSCLSAAELLAALFFDVMRFRPEQPAAPDADRFILSKGHAAPLLYGALAEVGLIPADTLITLRRIDSDLEGHPAPRLPGIDFATGSLGQGLSYGVGLALAGRLDGLERRVFVLLGDGECAEGSVWEAAALAAYYRLDRLVAVVDVNGFGQSQATMLGHDLAAYARRFRAFGWRAITVDGHDLARLVPALRRARRGAGRPTVVLARTVKGKGVPDVEGRQEWHGRPLPAELAEHALRALEGALRGAPLPGVRSPRTRQTAPEPGPPPPLPAPPWEPGQLVATREAYGATLAELGTRYPPVVALDADVKNSTYAERFAQACPDRFIQGFIAEQNLVGMAVGLAAGGKIPFASTFACFLTRSFDQIRMAAIGRANLKLCGSHAGVSVGEDGPSQMGLEDLAMVRAVPGAVILYPADAVAAARCVELAAAHPGLVYLRTTRPRTPVLYEPGEPFTVGGLKVLRQTARDRVTVVAAGITLHEALRAWHLLHERGVDVRVVDLYSVKPVDRAGLLAAARATGNRILTVEDHYAEGGLGEAVLEAVAGEGVQVTKLAVREVPRSGPAEALLERHGISSRHIVETVLRLGA